jgi:hypothetical protein
VKTALYYSILATAMLASVLVAAADPGPEPNASDQVRELRQRLDAIEREMSDAKPAAPDGTAGRASPAYMNTSFDVLANAGWSSTPDVQTLQPGGHDPSQRGFSIRNAELALDGAVDPYFKGFANIVLMTDAEDETAVELEEAYALTTSLPASLQIKGGLRGSALKRPSVSNPRSPKTAQP